MCHDKATGDIWRGNHDHFAGIDSGVAVPHCGGLSSDLAGTGGHRPSILKRLVQAFFGYTFGHDLALPGYSGQFWFLIVFCR